MEVLVMPSPGRHQVLRKIVTELMNPSMDKLISCSDGLDNFATSIGCLMHCFWIEFDWCTQNKQDVNHS